VIAWLTRLRTRTLIAVAFVATLGAGSGVALVRYTYSQEPTAPTNAPTEGFYWTIAQYQLAFQHLRLLVAKSPHAAPLSEESTYRAVIQARDVLEAKLLIMAESPEITPYFEAVEGYSEVVEMLRKLHADLRDLSVNALVTREGQAAFERRMEEVWDPLNRLANRLRIQEISLFESARENQVAVSKLYIDYMIGASAVIWVLGWGAVLVYASHTRRIARALRRETEAHAEAQRTADARATLVQMVSHELRNPIQEIFGLTDYIDVVAESSPIDRAAIADATAKLRVSSKLLSDQLDTVAQYGRIASEAATLRTEAFELRPLIQSIIASCAAEASAKGLPVSASFESLVPAAVASDAVRLRQILTNYLTNAIKYSPVGAGPIRVMVEASGPNSVGKTLTLTVSVSDSGSGIAPGDRDRIWEPFFRTRKSRGIKGSGLGLAVVKLLAESVKWEVGLRPDSAPGATFFVRFTAQFSNPPKAAAAAGGAPSS
jgi:signal transduction histidine kinase